MERELVRDLTHGIVAQRRRRLFGRCTFCGTPTTGAACASHRDLLPLDPGYVDPRLLLPTEGRIP